SSITCPTIILIVTCQLLLLLLVIQQVKYSTSRKASNKADKTETYEIFVGFINNL
ncbi:hypothetical protein SAMN02910357_00181, partial [Succinivibrio dextrinosolvens]